MLNLIYDIDNDSNNHAIFCCSLDCHTESIPVESLARCRNLRKQSSKNGEIFDAIRHGNANLPRGQRN